MHSSEHRVCARDGCEARLNRDNTTGYCHALHRRYSPKVREAQKAWRERNHEIYLAYQKTYREKKKRERWNA